MAPAAEALARGDRGAGAPACRRPLDVVRHPGGGSPVFDVALFIRTIGGALGLTAEEMAR